MWRLLPYIAVGGAVGAVARYAVTVTVQRGTQGTFPWGTLAVNVLGCLLMGGLAYLFFTHSVVREEWRFAALTGLLGAFTTFSTFSYEALGLLRGQQHGRALAYVLLTNVGCLTAVWLGYRLAERWRG